MARLCRVCRLVPPPSAAFEGVSARAAADSGLTVTLVCAYSPRMLTDHFRSRQPSAFVALRPSQPEPNRSRRPHPPATVDAMRQLVTATTLPLRVIAARTGTSATTVSRRARRHGWLRPKTGFPEDHWTAEGRRKLRRSAIRRGASRPGRAPRLRDRDEPDRPHQKHPAGRPPRPPLPQARRGRGCGGAEKAAAENFLCLRR